MKKRKSIERYKNPELLKELGRHCQQIREKKGYSIDRMSRESEQLSKGTIHRLETGTGDTQFTALYRYAKTLQIPMKRLFEFSMAENIED